MFRLVVKMVLSFLLHIGWDLGLVYASMSEDFINHPIFYYICEYIRGWDIVILIFGEITFVLLIFVYIFKPLQKKVYKIIYWSIASVFTILTFYFWYVYMGWDLHDVSEYL